MWVLARPNRSKLHGLARSKFISRALTWFTSDSLVCDRSRSGQYLSWVAEIALGEQPRFVSSKILYWSEYAPKSVIVDQFVKMDFTFNHNILTFRIEIVCGD